VTWNPVLQAQDAAQHQFLGAAKLRHVRGAICPAQHRRQRDEQNLQQLVACVVRARIGQPSENLLEFAHATPPSGWESSSESISRVDAILRSRPYAIPLPWRGRSTAFAQRMRSGGGESFLRLASQFTPPRRLRRRPSPSRGG